VHAPWGRWRGGTRLRAARRCGLSRNDEQVNRHLRDCLVRVDDDNFTAIRDRANRGTQHALHHQWRAGPQRRHYAEILRLRFRCDVHALLLPWARPYRPADLHQHTAETFARRPGLACHTRGRNRSRGDGGQPYQTQAARLCHRCELRRCDGNLLRGQAADGLAGDVHVPGLDHDSRHDRVGRHRQCRRRGGRRAQPAVAAIMVSAGPDAVDSRARRFDWHCLSAKA